MPSVLITGANRGLGLEYAKQYAADGWDVIATVRKPEEAGELEKLGAKVKVLPLTVTDATSVETLARQLKGQALSVIINNAGIYGPDTQNLEAMDYTKWEEVFRVNTLAPFHVALALLPNLKAAKQTGETPKLVFMSSILGSISHFEGGNYYAYASSKAALNMLGHGMAAEWKAHGIVVLLLHPGWVQTDMGGPNAPLKPPESIAGLRKVIANAKPADTGRYFDYQGEKLAW